MQVAKLYRREVALAELQHLIFVNDIRAYLEYSIEGRLAMAYIEEHWAEIMAELQAAIERKTGFGSSKGS
jgi:hypothetical protein